MTTLDKQFKEQENVKRTGKVTIKQRISEVVKSQAKKYSIIRPSLYELSSISKIIECNEETLLRFIDPNFDNDNPLFRNEFNLLKLELDNRRSRIINDLIYPDEWKVGTRSSYILYYLVRLRKPKIFVETGVANGVSSYFILNAMKYNNIGKLVSIDINKNVGVLLNENEKERWELFLLGRNSMKAFIERIDGLRMDMFMHDSNHRYKWQMFEYSNILKRLEGDFIFLSDDIDSSYAFMDFCKLNRFNPLILIDEKKLFGLLYPKFGF